MRAPTPAALDRIPKRLQSLAGPVLIVALVLVVRRDIAFHHALPTSDLTRLWLPTYDFLGRRLADGHIPGWDPNLFAGRRSPPTRSRAGCTRRRWCCSRCLTPAGRCA